MRGSDDHPEATGMAHGQHWLDASMFWGPAGGVHRTLATKQALLPTLGWRHTVLAPGATGPGRIDAGGLALPGSGGYRLVLDGARVQRLIEAAAPDLVEAADPYTVGHAALAAANRLGVPAVAFCHSHLPSALARLVGGRDAAATRRGRWASRQARNWLAAFYERFDLVLAPSLHVARDLRSWGLQRVAVQPLGVDCTTFRPEAANAVWRVNLCRRLEISPTSKLLVYSGRFAPEKNLDVLAAAVARLGPGFTLLAIGSGPAPPRGQRVFLMSPVADSRRLARILASADAYVHAGDRETFGLGVLEAMACATPLVVAAAGGTGELAADIGTTVPGLGVDEWAEAIRATAAAGRGPRTEAGVLRAQEHDWPWLLRQWSQRGLRLLARHAATPARGTERAAGWA